MTTQVLEDTLIPTAAVTEPTGAGPRRPARGFLGSIDIPALGGEHVTALEVIPELGAVAVAVDGRPAFAGGGDRFAVARRIPLRRLRTRHVLEPADGPRPGGYRVIGLLDTDLDRARELLAEPDPERFAAELPWVSARDVHHHLSRVARAALDQARHLPHTNLTAEVDRGRFARPVITPRFRAALTDIYETFLRDDCRLVLLEGDAGTGKSQLLRALASELLAGRAPARLQGGVVIKLGRAALDGSVHPENEMARDADLDTVIATGSVIVAIDEAHRLLRGTSGRSEALDLVKMLVTEQRLRLILCTNESSSLKGMDEALDRRMTVVRLPEADRDEVLGAILPAKAIAARGRGIARVEPGALERAYLVARKLGVHAQPHASVALLDAAIARAELHGDDTLSCAHVAELGARALGGGRDDADACGDALRADIVGHDAAVDGLARAYAAHQRRLLDAGERVDGRPFAFILQGPAGVGRRSLARALHRFRCGDTAGGPCAIAGRDFDKDWSVTGILGAPPGYVGFGRQSPALRVLKDVPRGVIVIEHPEDAHDTFATRVVLPILRGALTLSDGEVVSTRGACVAIVTRSGARDAARSIGFFGEPGGAGGNGSATRVAELRRAMPDILELVGERRVFHLAPLGDDASRALIRAWLAELDLVDAEGRLTEAVIDRAIASGPGGGAGALRRALDELTDGLHLEPGGRP